MADCVLHTNRDSSEGEATTIKNRAKSNEAEKVTCYPATASTLWSHIGLCSKSTFESLLPFCSAVHQPIICYNNRIIQSYGQNCVYRETAFLSKLKQTSDYYQGLNIDLSYQIGNLLISY